MELSRSSGILLHITSLPSPFGIGDLGPAAYDFVDFLHASGHRYWQILPLNPTHDRYQHSPYSSFSAFAGNPILISPELLEKEGLLELEEFLLPKAFSPGKVNFRAVQEFKSRIFEAAFQNFKVKKGKEDFEAFCETHASWLNDYSIYRKLEKDFEKGWTSWPKDYRDRDPGILEQENNSHSDFIEKEKFLQYVFFMQWKKLLNYAHRKKVQIIGDIPFYINHDSADCWAHPECFKLDAKKQPMEVSGVPPDLFSEDGQLWGTPVYDWKYLKSTKFEWWVNRIRQNLLLFDLVRLDHFRGFSACWEVSAAESTAKRGMWQKTPGKAFFQQAEKVFPEMPFIVEDLGSLDEPVFELIRSFDFPGMKVLQFAFGGELQKNPYIPYNHSPNNLVYTGTHDNNTTRGWYRSLGKHEKETFHKYAAQKVTAANAPEVLHRMALNSVAKIAIIPLQDINGLGASARMNLPGTGKGNWTWRVPEKDIPWERAQELKSLNSLYGRTSF